MESSVKVTSLKKTFKLSKKQMKIDKTKSNLKIAVNDISFEAYPNEIFGLLGPNGAGKTTTLRCISTLIKPDQGEIKLAGIDIKEDTKVKKHIGFLTNELKLEEQMTPNYAFEYFGKFYDLTKEQIEKRKEELFNEFGVNKFAEVKIGDLSTGMKQKVSIVVSLVHDPDIIIFDEPTNGLDVLTARTITDYLKNLAKNGKTVIISTHIMSLAQKLCDRIGIIIDGKMVICDTLENVLKEYQSDDLEEVFFEIYSKEAC
ncbi:MAG: ABC transporter ATP-binding protein [Bacilli bacterium]|nr:ABC transporter ATP-binding protein [Bacilli bacterium]